MQLEQYKKDKLIHVISWSNKEFDIKIKDSLFKL